VGIPLHAASRLSAVNKFAFSQHDVMRQPADANASPLSLAFTQDTADSSEKGTALSETQLDALCQKMAFSTNACTAWSDVQTLYAYAGNDYKPTQVGITTWSDLNAFVDNALQQSDDLNLGDTLSVTLHDYLMVDTPLPTQAQLQQLQKSLAQAGATKNLEIVMRGDPLDPPQAILLNAQGWTIGPLCPSEDAPNTVADTPVVLSALAEDAPHLHRVYQALEQSLADVQEDQDTRAETASLNEVLSRAIGHFNKSLSPDEQSYRVDERAGRTKIVNFTQALARSCERLALSHGARISPFDLLIAQTQRQGPSIYSIGGGQTLTLMLLAIQAMDCGRLPLDTRLEGDNRSSRDGASGHTINSAVAEIVEQNQRRTHLGKDLSIAQKGQCLIHMRPDAHRLASLRAHMPKWLLFNVPTNALQRVFTPNMMQVLSSLPSAPIMVLSAKSFSESHGQVDVPATELYKTLAKTPNNLQNKLLVLGGYFAAPWLATGSPVHFVVAGKDPQAVDSFANLMPDDQAGAIKHDRRYGKDELFGTAIMGALKNQAVYAFGRRVVQATFDQLAKFPEWTVDQHCSRLNAWAAPAADQAIAQAERAVEALTSRSAPHSTLQNTLQDNLKNNERDTAHPPSGKGIGTRSDQETGAMGLKSIVNFSSAPGVRTDFERCMVRPVEPPFVRFVSSLQEILRHPAAEQGAALQALLAREVVDSGKGFGSRNSRDGVIDQALRIVYERQVVRSECDLKTFSAFRTAWTPSSWLAKTTEGRNGMFPVLKHLSVTNREVPTLIQEAARLYGQVDERLFALANEAVNHSVNDAP
jgi:hypothetical protein